MTPCNRRVWSREPPRSVRPAGSEGGKGPMSEAVGTVAASEAIEEPAGRRKPQLSEGARAERRLGWMLCAPAVIVMIAVTAFPVGYAVYLSLERYNLELPNAVK